jgi:hypothetical protein
MIDVRKSNPAMDSSVCAAASGPALSSPEPALAHRETPRLYLLDPDQRRRERARASSFRRIKWEMKMRPAILFILTLVALAGLSPTASAQQVQIVRSFSGQFYGIRTMVQGAFVYSDRDYVFHGFDPCLQNRPYLVTPNRDKFTRGPALVDFTADRSVFVVIGYDTRYGSRPEWLVQGFRPTGHQITVTDSNQTRVVLTFQLWRSHGPVNGLRLGGNLTNSENANNGMYTAIFLPAEMQGCIN